MGSKGRGKDTMGTEGPDVEDMLSMRRRHLKTIAHMREATRKYTNWRFRFDFTRPVGAEFYVTYKLNFTGCDCYTQNQSPDESTRWLGRLYAKLVEGEDDHDGFVISESGRLYRMDEEGFMGVTHTLVQRIHQLESIRHIGDGLPMTIGVDFERVHDILKVSHVKGAFREVADNGIFPRDLDFYSTDFPESKEYLASIEQKVDAYFAGRQ